MLPSAIRIKIEARFGKAIRYSKDCEALSKSIEHACSDRVSATTIKRLFGFAKNIDKPRLYTLDILANYIGYQDYSSLLASIDEIENAKEQHLIGTVSDISPTGDIYALQQQLIVSLTTQHIDIDRVIGLCHQFGGNKEITPFVIELINLAAKTKNLLFLKQVFKLPNVFDESMHDQGQIFYIGQTIGLVLRSLPDLSTELAEAYANNANARKFLVEWFVDEDYLLGYYGRLLDRYHQQKRSKIQDRSFYYALKYTQAMQSGEIIRQKDWYQKIKHLDNNQDIHPILAGRIIGIGLSEERSHSINKRSVFFKSIKERVTGASYESAIAFLLYMNRYLFKSQRLDWMKASFDLFEEHFTADHSKTYSHWGRKIENQLYIYQAYINHQMGDKKTAKALLQSIDPNLFEAFMYKQIHLDYSSVSDLILNRKNK